MRRAASLSSVVVAVAALAASSALAAPAAPAPPRLSAVASAAFPALPELVKAPADIPAGERVDGLELQVAPWGGGNHTEIRAVAGQCLRGPMAWTDAPDKPVISSMDSLRAFARVLPVRTERLVQEKDGTAALEVQDLWVDPRSRAARLHATTRLPLTRLGAGPGGMGIYGLRASGALHVVVPAEQRGVVVDSQGGFHHMDCGHVRVALDPPEKGSGAMAQIATFAAPPPAPIPVAEAAGQLRPLLITASLTQLSRDPEPVVSVRAAWTRTTPFQPGPIPQAAPGVPESPVELPRGE